MTLTSLLAQASPTGETFEQTEAPDIIAAFFMNYSFDLSFQLAFALQLKCSGMISHLIPGALGGYLNFLRASVSLCCIDDAGKYMAQIKLGKSASQSSAALTTQPYPNCAAKQHSRATAVN